MEKSFVARVVFTSTEDDPTKTVMHALNEYDGDLDVPRPNIDVETIEVTPYEKPGLFTILCEGKQSVTFRGRWADAQRTARELYAGLPYEIVELQV